MIKRHKNFKYCLLCEVRRQTCLAGREGGHGERRATAEQEGNGPLDSRAKVMITNKKFSPPDSFVFCLKSKFK